MKFQLKILAIDFFAQDLIQMFARYHETVEFVTPPEEVLSDFDRLEVFVRTSSAHVVFLEEEINLHPRTGADLLDACKGKIVYETSLLKRLNCDPKFPTFPRDSGVCPFPAIFLYRNGCAEALIMAFIHNLRHWVEAKLKKE